MFTLPIVISLISFAISAYTLWSSRLAPFNLRVLATGRVDFIQTPAPNSLQRIAMQLLFVNEGARRGYVSNVAIAISGDNVVKSPQFFVAFFEDIDAINFAKEHQDSPKWITFSTFTLNPGETLLKRIVFLPKDTADAKLTYKAGDYTLTLYSVEEGKQDWKRRQSVSITLDEQGELALSQTNVALPTSNVIPSTLHSVWIKSHTNILKKLDTKP